MQFEEKQVLSCSMSLKNPHMKHLFKICAIIPNI